MHDELRAAAASPLFTAARAPYLLLSPNLRIYAANQAYLGGTGRERDEVLGCDLFDAFPDNPADAAADGVAKLGASLERVLRHRRSDQMPGSATTSRRRTATPSCPRRGRC